MRANAISETHPTCVKCTPDAQLELFDFGICRVADGLSNTRG